MTPSPSTPPAAIVGVGFIGQAHIEALRRLNVPIAGVLGHEEGYTRREAARLSLRPYLSLDDLLADPQVAVVHQCGPNDVHSAQNLLALAAGKHVFSEKPLGTTPLETRRQLEFARASKLQHAVHFTYRGYPMVRELRERVRRGDLGEIRFIRGRYFQDWLLKEDDYNWRLEAKASETRTVGDIGSHVLDLTRYVTGLEPTRLFARFAQMHQTRFRPSGQVQTFANSSERGTPFTVQTEDQATLLVEYGELVCANFEVAQVYAGHQNDLCLELFGTEGSARWSQENPEEIVLGHRDRPNEVLRKSALLSSEAAKMAHYPGGHPEGYPDAILNAIRAFYASLEHQGLEQRDLEAGYATFEDGHAAALAVAAAQKSHQEGGWVRLEDFELSRQRVGGVK